MNDNDDADDVNDVNNVNNKLKEVVDDFDKFVKDEKQKEKILYLHIIVSILSFFVGLFFGFILGANGEREEITAEIQKDAIEAGVGRYVIINPTNQAAQFQWITNR